MNRLLKLLFIILAAQASKPACADEWPTEPVSTEKKEPESTTPTSTPRRIVLGHLEIDLVMSPPKDGKAELNAIVYHPGQRDKTKAAQGVSLKINGQNITPTGESISVGNGTWSHHQFFSIDAKREWPPSTVVTYMNESRAVDFKTQDNIKNRALGPTRNIQAPSRPKSFGNKMADQANKMATVENPFNEGSNASVIAERRGNLAAQQSQSRGQR